MKFHQEKMLVSGSGCCYTVLFLLLIIMFSELKNSIVRFIKNQCGGSGMFIPDPGFRIQKQQQKREVKKSLLSYLFM
jgi:hypothetical protein